ncbi:MAG: DUF5693 family protein [bacterium]|nr:DUF5693 family protein [bacterium]
MSKKSILFLLITISLLWALVLVARRYSWENSNKSVAVAIDADGLQTMALSQGLTLEQAITAVKTSGATALGVTEDTLSSLRQRGLIRIEYGNKNDKIYNSPRCTYVVCPEKNLAGDLAARFSRLLGVDQVKLFSDSGSWIVRLTVIDPELEETFGLGFSQELLRTAQQHGLYIVLRPYGLQGLSQVKDWSSIQALVFAGKKVSGYPQDIPKTIAVLSDIPVKIGQVEFTSQAGMNQLTNITGIQQKVVRVHSLSEKEIRDIVDEKRKMSMGSLVDRWARAVKERNVRLLYIQLFPRTFNGINETVFDFNLSYIRQITARLIESGYQLNGISGLSYVTTNKLNIGLTGLGVWAIAALIVLTLWPSAGMTWAYSFPGFVVMHILLTWLSPSLWYARGLALAASMLFPFWAYLWLQNEIEHDLGPGYFKTARIFSLTTMISFGGAVFVSALLFGSYFWQKIGSFSGIKLALTVPLLAILWHYLRQDRDYPWKKFWEQTVTYKHLLLVALIAAGMILYLWRSGNNGALFVSMAEEKLRRLLDQVLLVRPRTKEIFFGHPFLILGIYLGLKKCRNLLALVAGFVGQLSLVNTFCHVHTPLVVSFWRVLNGWWLGLAIGWIFIWCYQKYLQAEKKGEQLCLKF